MLGILLLLWSQAVVAAPAWEQQPGDKALAAPSWSPALAMDMAWSTPAAGPYVQVAPLFQWLLQEKTRTLPSAAKGALFSGLNHSIGWPLGQYIALEAQGALLMGEGGNEDNRFAQWKWQIGLGPKLTLPLGARVVLLYGHQGVVAIVQMHKNSTSIIQGGLLTSLGLMWQSPSHPFGVGLEGVLGTYFQPGRILLGVAPHLRYTF